MNTTKTTKTTQRKAGDLPDLKPGKRYKLKNKLFPIPRRLPGWFNICVTVTEKDLVEINKRCKELGLMRSVYIRQLCRADIVRNGPLAIHALRFDLLKETEASLANLKAEHEQLRRDRAELAKLAKQNSRSQTTDARSQTPDPRRKTPAPAISAASEPSIPEPASNG